ncbi:402_t:CDS:2, partial [Paraglomus occultum]
KDNIIGAFERTFDEISNSTSLLSGIKKKAQKLASKVEEKFQRKEIVDFFKVLDSKFEMRQGEHDLVNFFDKSGRELLKMSGNFSKGELATSVSNQYDLRKKQRRIFPSELDQELLSENYQAESVNASEIEYGMLRHLEAKAHLENYNIVCLFDVEFPWTKRIFKILSMAQLDMLRNKWRDAQAFIKQEIIEECWNASSVNKLVDDYHEVIEENVLRRRSALLGSSASEFQYRDEIVNPLLSYIFYDVEDALWIKT